MNEISIIFRHVRRVIACMIPAPPKSHVAELDPLHRGHGSRCSAQTIHRVQAHAPNRGQKLKSIQSTYFRNCAMVLPSTIADDFAALARQICVVNSQPQHRAVGSQCDVTL